MAPRYTDDRKPWTPPADVRLLFQDALQTVLADEGTIAAEATWERLAKTVAKHWQAFPDQSPLSTWNMLAKCGEMILKIRLASKRSKAEKEESDLEAFEALMREVYALDGDERVPRQEEPVAVESWEDEGDEPGEDDSDDDD